MSWNWKPAAKRWRKPSRPIRVVLIGIIIGLTASLLSGCGRSAVPVLRLRPINCKQDISTPAKTLDCLEEYDIEYGSAMKILNGEK